MEKNRVLNQSSGFLDAPGTDVLALRNKIKADFTVLRQTLTG